MNKNSDKTKAQLLAELAELRKKSKEQEDKLKAAHQQLDASSIELRKSLIYTLENMSDGFVSLDENWYYTYVNKKAGEMFGRKAEDLVGKHIWTEFPEGIGQPFYKNYYKAVETQKEIHFEDYYSPWDRWFENRVFPSKKGLSIFFQDITEHKMAEEALKESELKFQKIINESFEGISVVNEEGKIIVWNNAFEKITGIKKTETINRYIWDVETKLIDREETNTKRKNEIKSTLLNVLKTGEAPWLNKAMERDYVHTNGTVKIVSGRMYTIKTQKGYLIVSISKDVNERKQAEEALKEAQSNLQALLDNRNDSIWSLDRNYNFIVFNKPYADVIYSNMGIRVEKGMNALEIHPQEVNDFWKPKFDEVFEGKYVTFEFSYVLDGKEHFFEVFMNPIYTEDEITGLSALSMDITERKHSEKELTKLSAAVTQSPSVIVITDTDGKMEYVNPKFTEITGYSLEEAIGQNPHVLKSGGQADELYKEFWETISSGKVWRGEFHNKRKNGELFWEMASVSPIFDEQGKIINYIKVAEDITKQKRNEQIQTIIHNISNAIITSHNSENFLTLVKDELGKIIDTTNFFIALYDEPTDSISLPFHKDLKDSSETFPAGKTLTNYVIKTRKSLLATKAVKAKLKKSGKIETIGHSSEVWLGVPLKNENKVIGILAVQSYDNENAFDEADVKMLEIISDQISLSLERVKAEEDLKFAKEKAEESNRLKTAFLNNMSHEIRTPLNGITGFIGLLQDSEIDDEQKQEFFDIINKSSNRLITTVTDIVDISKIEAGLVEVVNSEVSVSEILEEQYSFFYREAQSKGLELIYTPTVSDNESRIITDKHKLEGILTNLIKNAIKYTDTGSITIGYAIKTLGNKDVVEFYVKDTGIGIPANRLDAIFNRFEQADIADTRAFQGSGLGLAIVKSYVEMLGGKISVKSKEGDLPAGQAGGSTFTFSIPYTKKLEKESDAKVNINKEPQKSLSHISLIIAEDDETSRLLYETIFRGKFNKIIFTTTGKETIEKFRDNPSTDIILMDIQMPDMNGYDATREIRKFNTDVVIIAQTAYGLAGDREKALEAGCNDYIAKPIKKEILFEKIMACLDKKTI